MSMLNANDANVKKSILRAQRNEITEHHIYIRLAASTKNPHNQKVLNQIAADELKHYNFWKTYSKREIRPNKIIIWFYYIISRVFGLTFGVRLMEKGEERAQINYSEIIKAIPEAQPVLADEEAHENALIDILDEELLDYISSVVLGLNDALVELTGALAGLTLAFNDTKLIAVAGLVTGIAASLSMGASEYLATKSEEGTKKNPFKAAIYTGGAYIVTVIFLIIPYLLFSDLSPVICLIFALINAIIIVFVFTFYISVAKDLPFRKRFFEIVGISLGIAALTFVIGMVVSSVLNVDI